MFHLQIKNEPIFVCDGRITCPLPMIFDFPVRSIITSASSTINCESLKSQISREVSNSIVRKGPVIKRAKWLVSLIQSSCSNTFLGDSSSNFMCQFKWPFDV